MAAPDGESQSSRLGTGPQAADALPEEGASGAGALRQQAERLGEALDGLGDALVCSDARGCVLGLNHTAQVLTGWTLGEALGRPQAEVCCLLDERSRQPLVVTEAGGALQPALLRARDGTERPVEVSAATLRQSGAAAGSVRLFRDVSERRRSEIDRARLASIEASEDAIVSKTLDGIVLSWNAGAQRIFGYAPREIIGQPVARIVPPELREADRQILERLRRGERIEPYETVRVSKTGRRIDLSVNTSPLRDGQGRVIGELKVARDVTDRKQAEAALRQSEGRHRFLADLAAVTQPLSEAAAIMAATARLLAEYLGVDRCAYAEVEDESLFVITGDYTIGVPSIVGRWPVAGFGAECVRRMRANEPYVVDDVDSDPRVSPTDLPAFRATTIQAVICVPLHKGGRFTAAMAVHQKVARRWTPAEVELVRTVVGCCWESLERARVTRTLQESEQRYRAIVEATPECVKVISCDGTLLQMNRAGLAMIEAERPEDALGQSIYGVIAPEYWQAFHELNERVCHGEAGTLRFEIIGLRGTRRHMETGAVPLPSPQGGFVHLAVTRDVTERVAAEQSLRESEERYRRAAAEAARAAEANAKFRAFFEQGTHFAWVLALDGAVVEANRLCLDACGFRREDVIGQPFWQCGWWSRSAELLAMVRAACAQAADGKQFRIETNYFVADGGERTVDLILAPVTDDMGRVLFVAASGIDVTERRQMEDSLRAADRKKDEFIALLAHELRNPLAPIRTGLQVMRLAGNSTETVERARQMMERQLGHMVRLVDDLLDVSRINRNKMELRRGRVLLSDVISSAVETARPLLDAERHELSVAMPHVPVYLDADLTRLAQVFSNLLTNSAKYTERGGHIWLSAERRGGDIVVSVRDTGIGIPREALGSIFDMFAQLDRPLERSSGGLGIGLALVKGLVEMHGGSVKADSAGPGQGSTFTVTLPILTQPIQHESPECRYSGPTAPRSRRRILVVDDSFDGAESLALVLRLLGDEVRVAHDGLEAVEAAERFRPHVILMDLGMPRLNGYDATRRIRQQPWGRDITILALTGWGQDSDRARSHEAGCDGHLVKPVNLTDLQERLAAINPAEPRPA